MDKNVLSLLDNKKEYMNTLEDGSEIKENILQNKTVILNLSATENEQVQKDIINFINETYNEFVHRISEKVYIISLQPNDKNIIEGALWS